MLMATQSLCKGNFPFCVLTGVQGSAWLFSMLLLLLLLPLQLKWLLRAWPGCIGSPGPLESVVLGSCDVHGRFKLLLPLFRPAVLLQQQLLFWQLATVSAPGLS